MNRVVLIVIFYMHSACVLRIITTQQHHKLRGKLGRVCLISNWILCCCVLLHGSIELTWRIVHSKKFTVFPLVKNLLTILLEFRNKSPSRNWMFLSRRYHKVCDDWCKNLWDNYFKVWFTICIRNTHQAAVVLFFFWNLTTYVFWMCLCVYVIDVGGIHSIDIWSNES